MSPLQNGGAHKRKKNLNIFYFAYDVNTKQIAFVNRNCATLAPLYFVADVISSLKAFFSVAYVRNLVTKFVTKFVY